MQYTYEQNWKKRYELLKIFYEEHGHLLVPNDYTVENIQLGLWLTQVRSNKKRLNTKYIKMLNDLGMIWNRNEYKWQLHYMEAKNYYDKNCNLSVCRKDNTSLYNWLINQRRLYKKGELTSEKILMLNQLKFNLDGSSKINDTWLEKYKIAKKYYDEKGNLNISTEYFYEGIYLGRWLQYQRRNQNKLSTEQKELLNNIGMEWEALRTHLSWEKAYELAKQFYEEYKHLNIPNEYIFKNYNLSRWIINQRKKYNANKLSYSKIALLNEINMCWDPRLSSWMQRFYEAKMYYEQNGNLFISTNYKVNGKNLNSWIVEQRSKYKNNKLSKQQIELLESIGMIWDLEKYNWQFKFHLATKYYQKYGDLLISRNYKSQGVNLGAWIASLRLRKDSLTQEQVETLESIGMKWRLIETDRKTWEESYQIAKMYYKKYNNLALAAHTVFEDYNLGSWITKQRKQYKDNKLSKEKVKLLEDIGMIWNLKSQNAQENWLEKFNYAKQYYELYGNMINITDIEIKRWINQQRIKYKNNLLSEDQIDKLNSIGMVWDLRLYKWYLRYEEIKEYKEKYGCLNDLKIKQWVTYQKTLYEQNKLTDRQIELLEKIDIYLITDDKTWLKHYRVLQHYFQEYGFISNIQDERLIFWLENQRENYKSNKLSMLQIDLLNKIGMIWDLDKYHIYNEKITKYNLLYYKKKMEESLLEVLERINTNADFENIESIKNIEKHFIRKIG